ncbi:hypothetical protein EB796_013010 [Bugula neritina]|uniref:Uncharacterized protein n=1 Tax=Bugula neritina TaxID=10212 RepID=A0A7J7JQQ2_BUGNE|nr:hypothetical protein EB796_013010 [Bugula neritina]
MSKGEELCDKYNPPGNGEEVCWADELEWNDSLVQGDIESAFQGNIESAFQAASAEDYDLEESDLESGYLADVCYSSDSSASSSQYDVQLTPGAESCTTTPQMMLNFTRKVKDTQRSSSEWSGFENYWDMQTLLRSEIYISPET